MKRRTTEPSEKDEAEREKSDEMDKATNIGRPESGL
jgi:hypothetical protein